MNIANQLAVTQLRFDNDKHIEKLVLFTFYDLVYNIKIPDSCLPDMSTGTGVTATHAIVVHANFSAFENISFKKYEQLDE